MVIFEYSICKREEEEEDEEKDAIFVFYPVNCFYSQNPLYISFLELASFTHKKQFSSLQHLLKRKGTLFGEQKKKKKMEDEGGYDRFCMRRQIQAKRGFKLILYKVDVKMVPISIVKIFSTQ